MKSHCERFNFLYSSGNPNILQELETERNTLKRYEKFLYVSSVFVFRTQSVVGCSEISALEKLVQRYQAELCNSGQLRPVEKSCGEFIRVLEYIFELQNLDPHAVATGEEKAVFCRTDGKFCRFEEIRLPSNEWQWIGSWVYEVDRSTDLDGWSYGTSREGLLDMRQGHR